MESDRKIARYKDLPALRRRASRRHQKIGFTSGCYDLLHLGHITHFAFCRSHCDLLVVSVGNDKNVRHLKGAGRPILPARARARSVAALMSVDWVVLSRERGIFDFAQQFVSLRPDIFFVPETDAELAKKEAFIRAVGGKLFRSRRTPPREFRTGISTTDIITRIRDGSSV
ncbi:MAG: adenylyltransferase/cytidyltransferase family protein [Candidatus Kerfeldbacteria bacterium]|nr:adenylyltransferase/cytidyltransferase family protein [Candidatus Kerfeldbacteria bacterium]